MRALTLQQPYASAIAIGPKRIENRPWRRTLPAGGEWVALHAGRTLYEGQSSDDLHAQMVECGWTDCPLLGDLPRGVLLGVMHVDAIVWHRGQDVQIEAPFDQRSRRVEMDPWAFGPWCWCIDAVHTLAQPIPCRGMQGLWPVPGQHVADLQALITGR